MGSDSLPPVNPGITLLFQFTLPHGERLADFTASADTVLCFNSRSRMGSDPLTRKRIGSNGVSIHAPAWGATSPSSPAGHSPARFNSRSRMGSDRLAPLPRLSPMRFNSRSRMGSDPPVSPDVDHVGGFNSRSRVGSDMHRRASASEWASFNSRSRVGSDSAKALWDEKQAKFQFTLPRGERR